MVSDTEFSVDELVRLIKLGLHIDRLALEKVLIDAPDSIAMNILKLSVMAYDSVQKGLLVAKEK